MASLVVIGDLNLDVLLEVPRFPTVDDEIEVLARKSSIGGDAANISAAAARLGLSVALIARAGNDPEGHTLISELERLGVDTRYIQQDPELPTGYVISIIRPDGQRNLLADRGANRHLHLNPTQQQGIVESQIVHLSDPHPWIIAEILALRASHTRLSLDPGGITVGRGLAALEPLLAETDIFFANEAEACRLSGFGSYADAARSILLTGPEMVVVKRGAMGCSVFTATTQQEVPGYPVKAVDTTGAGDAFDAAFLTAILQNKPVLEAAQFANAVGALSTLGVGAQTSQPDRQQIVAFMNEAKKDGQDDF